jgi:hypothetical protein
VTSTWFRAGRSHEKANKDGAVDKQQFVDCPIRQKMLNELPGIREKLMTDETLRLMAEFNRVDNFVLVVRYRLINELMSLICDDLCKSSSEKDKDWWYSGFSPNAVTSSRTPDHREIYAIAGDTATSVYYELNGRRQSGRRQSGRRKDREL